jgi:hypothetical protein
MAQEDTHPHQAILISGVQSHVTLAVTGQAIQVILIEAEVMSVPDAASTSSVKL